MHIHFELVIAIICIVFGVLLQWKAPRAEDKEPLLMGLTDMQFLGMMVWIAGLVLLMDGKWHFLMDEN